MSYINRKKEVRFMTEQRAEVDPIMLGKEKERLELGQEFEDHYLFQAGRLSVDPETYVDEMVKGSSPRHVDYLREYYAKHLPWITRFNRKVPANWDRWYNVEQAFEFAGRINAQLSPELIDAGVSHYHHVVVFATVKSQTLSLEQFAEALKTDQSGPGDIEYGFLNDQFRLGMRPRELDEAEKLIDQKMQARIEAFEKGLR